MLRCVLSGFLACACAAPLAATVRDLERRPAAFNGQDVVVTGVATRVTRTRADCWVAEKREMSAVDPDLQVPQGPLRERLELCVLEQWRLRADGAEVRVRYLTETGSTVRDGAEITVEGNFLRNAEDEGVLDALRVSAPPARQRPPPGDE